MSLENTNDAKLAKLQECKSPEDLMAFLAEEGVELSDEQLEAVAGGKLTGMSLEEIMAMFGEALESLFPENYDPALLWGNLPLAGH
jgi:hypothetical protein